MKTNNNKNIAINLLWLSHKDATGGFVYAQNLLDNLFLIDKRNKYTVFLNKHNFRYFKKRYGVYDNVSFVIIDIRQDIISNPIRAIRKLAAKIKNDDAKMEDIVRREIQTYINKKNIDTLFFPSGIIYPKYISDVKTVSTIYDLQHEYFPENFSKNQISFRKRNYKYTAENSDHIIAISNYTKKTVIEKYDVNPDKITVIYLSANESVKKNKISHDNVKLPERFLFYPAALWPHKNHKILIEALNGLKDEFPDLHLIFTGIIKKETLKKELDDLINKYGLKEKVLFLGYVSDEILDLIYKKAQVLVFPSSFEGFGIPIIEAFNRGIPVVAADNSSIREITGDAGLLFETNDKEECKKCIEEILTDKSLREELVEKGIKQAKNFSWEKTALQTLNIFNSP